MLACVPKPPPPIDTLIQIFPSNGGIIPADGESIMTIKVKLDVPEGTSSRNVTLTASQGTFLNPLDGNNQTKAQSKTDKKDGTATFQLKSSTTSGTVLITADVSPDPIATGPSENSNNTNLLFRKSIEVEFAPACPDNLQLFVPKQVVFSPGKTDTQDIKIIATIKRKLLKGSTSEAIPIKFSVLRKETNEPIRKGELVVENLLTNKEGTVTATLKLPVDFDTGILLVQAEAQCNTDGAKPISVTKELDVVVCPNEIRLKAKDNKKIFVLADQKDTIAFTAQLQASSSQGKVLLKGVPILFKAETGSGDDAKSIGQLSSQTVETNGTGAAITNLSLEPNVDSGSLVVTAEAQCGSSNSLKAIYSAAVHVCADTITLSLENGKNTIVVNDDTSTTQRVEVTATLRRQSQRGSLSQTRVQFEVTRAGKAEGSVSVSPGIPILTQTDHTAKASLLISKNAKPGLLKVRALIKSENVCDWKDLKVEGTAELEIVNKE